VLCRPLQAYAASLFRIFCDCLDNLAPVAFASQLVIDVKIYITSVSVIAAKAEAVQNAPLKCMSISSAHGVCVGK
jgi:exo-beta-1,3-glucanase (GH17 family)